MSIAFSSHFNSSYTLDINASGLRDAQLRMDVVANNVANSNTSGFEPQRIDSSSNASGGVSAKVSSEVSPTSQRRAIELSNETGSRSVLFSNTDLPTELANMIQAKAAYQANAKALERNEETWRTLLKVV